MKRNEGNLHIDKPYEAMTILDTSLTMRGPGRAERTPVWDGKEYLVVIGPKPNYDVDYLRMGLNPKVAQEVIDITLRLGLQDASQVQLWTDRVAELKAKLNTLEVESENTRFEDIYALVDFAERDGDVRAQLANAETAKHEAEKAWNVAAERILRVIPKDIAYGGENADAGAEWSINSLGGDGRMVIRSGATSYKLPISFER